MLTLLCALACSWLAVKKQQADRQREAISAIRKSGGTAWYADGASPNPPAPTWLIDTLGVDFFADVASVHFANDADDLLIAADLNADAGLTDLTIFVVFNVNFLTANPNLTRPVGIGSVAGVQANPGDNFNLAGDPSIRKDNGQHYDRFRHRMMFPIRDRRGRTIAFGGRVIDAEDNPKYLNSPESPVFHKGDEIYGLYELKKAVSQIDQIFITEGYMDVIALAEHGVKTAVATLGTAINNAQIEKLFRSCKTLVFCFDGDAAGKKAAWRSLEQCLVSLKEGRLARFLFLPDDHDPDTFIQEYGQLGFQNQVNNAATLTEFLFETLLAQCNIQSLEGRSQFLDRLRPYFTQIPLQSLKDQILGEVEHQLAVKLDNRLLEILGHQKPAPERSLKLPDQHWTPTRLAINLLLLKPSLADNTGAHHELAETDIPGVDLFLQLLDHIHEEPGISTQNLLDRFRGNEHETHLYKLAAMQPAMENEESIDRMFENCLQRLQEKYIKGRRTILIQKLQRGETLSDAEKQELK